MAIAGLQAAAEWYERASICHLTRSSSADPGRVSTIHRRLGATSAAIHEQDTGKRTREWKGLLDQTCSVDFRGCDGCRPDFHCRQNHLCEGCASATRSTHLRF